MAVTIRWYGDQVTTQMHRALERGLKRAALHLKTRAQLLVSRPARRIRRRRQRNTPAGKKGSQYTEFVGSRASQPPKLRTGFGRRNVAWEFDPDRLVARVGVRTNAVYMIYLELGTDRIQPRPWLTQAMEDTRDAVASLIRAELNKR